MYRRKVRFILLSGNVVVILSELKYVPPSPIHQNIKDAIVRAKETDTVHILRTLHNSARVYANKPAKEVVRIEKQPGGAKFEDVRPLVAGARGRVVYETGDVDYGTWTAGISMGLIKDVQTCEELVRRMEGEAEDVINGLAGLVVGGDDDGVKVKAKAKL